MKQFVCLTPLNQGQVSILSFILIILPLITICHKVLSHFLIIFVDLGNVENTAKAILETPKPLHWLCWPKNVETKLMR